MISWDTFLAREFFGNSVESIGLSFVVLVCIVIVLRGLLQYFTHSLAAFARTTRTKIDDAFVAVVDRIHPLSYVAVGLYASSGFLVLPALALKIITAFAIIAIVVEVVRIAQSAILFFIGSFWLKDGGEAKQLEMLVGIVVRLVLWSVGVLLVLSNIGIDVTSLVASLGIGGIAVALAAQSILGDLFSAFTIYTDKPFKIGDFIIVGEHKGVVKQVGLKTTRIEALEGEEIIIPNNELTSTRVRNFKRMKKRRVEFQIGVEYGTPLKKLQRIPAILEDVIRTVSDTEFDRVHFKDFADSSLIFEVVFFITNGNYTLYMDTRQAINLGIVKAFEAEKIAMAFPTRTLHIVQ